MQKHLIKILYELREIRGAKFMFRPMYFSYKEIILAIYYEYFDNHKSDMIIISVMIKELEERGIIATGDGVERSVYRLSNFTFYDIYIQTIDGGKFSRGTSIDESEAYAKAIGEVFERTSSRYNINESNIISTYKNLEDESKKDSKIKYVKLESFAMPTNKQKEYFLSSNITSEDIFSFVKVISLKDNQEYYIPAQTTYYKNNEVYNEEKMIIGASTHGSGAGYKREDAIKSGLCEIINRHFYLLSWYFSIIPKRINTNTIPKDKLISKLIKDLEDRGFTINLLDYSVSAGIPSVICVLEKYGGWYVGGTAGLDIDKVILRSISEALATYLWSSSVIYKGGCNINQNIINKVQMNFIDDIYGDAYHKVLLFGHESYVRDKLNFKDFIKGELISYDTEYNKEVYIKDKNENKAEINSNFDLESHALKLFDKVYIKEFDNKYLLDYDYKSCKIIIPNCYNFALHDAHSRPILNKSHMTYPQNTEFNPFP